MKRKNYKMQSKLKYKIVKTIKGIKNTKINTKTNTKTNTNKTITIMQSGRGGISNIPSIPSIPSIPYILVLYNSIPITYGTYLTQQNCSREPIIKLFNISNIYTYLIIMTDNDAPKGLDNPKSNHTFIHWIYTQKANIINTYMNYIPPTPPLGIHKYYFSLYNITKNYNLIIQKIKTITNSNDRHIISANQNIINYLERFKIGKEFYYKVKSNNTLTH